jgi:hypothetical protein
MVKEASTSYLAIGLDLQWLTDTYPHSPKSVRAREMMLSMHICRVDAYMSRTAAPANPLFRFHWCLVVPGEYVRPGLGPYFPFHLTHTCVNCCPPHMHVCRCACMHACMVRSTFHTHFAVRISVLRAYI